MKITSRLIRVVLIVGLSLIVLSGCATAPAPTLQTTVREGTEVRWISLAQLEQSLPPAPIHAVFDVDDTTLFTSAGFQWGTRTYGRDIVSAGVSVREEDLPTTEARGKYREFWRKMNNELDEFSVKKWIAVELIRMHKGRGDQIFFVTKRINTGSERLTELLAREFDLPGLSSVIFTNRGAK